MKGSERVRLVVVALVATVLAYFSLLAAPDVGVGAAGPLGVVSRDKWFHAAGYAALGLALAAAFRRRSAVGTAALAAGGAVAYGVGMELLQGPLSARTLDPLDATANAAGAVLAAACWWAIGRRRSAAPPSSQS
ncbi:VanZ family protein [Halomicrococcus sp. SG-WS-1]|uniref:VanZ family protein n=1 Tax=Halomicrococcus sp. SG-WS-1 TaxID=3439057 RepID=UPI003F79BB24